MLINYLGEEIIRKINCKNTTEIIIDTPGIYLVQVFMKNEPLTPRRICI